MPKGKQTNKKSNSKDNNKLNVEETTNHDLINLKSQIEALKAKNEKLRHLQQSKIMQSYNNIQVSNKNTHKTTNSLLNSVNTNKQHKKKLAVISSDSDDSNKRLSKKTNTYKHILIRIIIDSQSDAEDSNQYNHSESSMIVNTEDQNLSTSLLQEPTNIASETFEGTNSNKKQASKNKRITLTK
ncbi:13009_t:CDS:2, partial [Racocetra fulgida]